MLRSSGYIRKPRIMNFICQAYRVRPLGRAILEYLHEQADYNSAMYITNARRIAEDINSTRRAVVWEQLGLKRKGLLAYSHDEGNKVHGYFIPFVVISPPDADQARITRLWDEAIIVAKARGVIAPAADSASLEEILFSRGGRWTHEERLQGIFSKEITDFSANSILSPDPAELLPAKAKKALTEAERAIGEQYMAEIGRKLSMSSENIKGSGVN